MMKNGTLSQVATDAPNNPTKFRGECEGRFSELPKVDTHFTFFSDPIVVEYEYDVRIITTSKVVEVFGVNPCIFKTLNSVYHLDWS